jgi:hypothetical protein
MFGRLKSDLSRPTRSRKSSASSASDAATRKWLKKSATRVAEDETQRKLHSGVEPYIGSLSNIGPADAASVRTVIRLRLKRRYGTEGFRQKGNHNC